MLAAVGGRLLQVSGWGLARQLLTRGCSGLPGALPGGLARTR